MKPDLANMHVWQFNPILKLPDDGNIDVWNIPAAGGARADKGSNAKALLAVAPNEDVTGVIDMLDLLYKQVFLIGMRQRLRGVTSATSPAGSTLLGNAAGINISFAAGIAVRPIVFLANINSDMINPTARNWWGDFLNFGTVPNTAKNNFAEWMDLYLQKLQMPNGNYGFDDPAIPTLITRSFLVQPGFGGFAKLFFSELDVRWGWSTLFGRPSGEAGGDAFDNGRVRLSKVMLRAMPPSTSVYPKSGHPAAVDPLAGLDRGQPERRELLRDRLRSGFRREGRTDARRRVELLRAGHSPSGQPDVHRQPGQLSGVQGPGAHAAGLYRSDRLPGASYPGGEPGTRGAACADHHQGRPEAGDQVDARQRRTAHGRASLRGCHLAEPNHQRYALCEPERHGWDNWAHRG